MMRGESILAITNSLFVNTHAPVTSEKVEKTYCSSYVSGIGLGQEIQLRMHQNAISEHSLFRKFLGEHAILNLLLSLCKVKTFKEAISVQHL